LSIASLQVTVTAICAYRCIGCMTETTSGRFTQ